MSSEITSLIAFSCMFGGAIFGIFLHSHLPEHHLTEDSKHVVNLGAGVIGTMAALVLGLLVASAKSNYDTQNNEVLDVSAKLALLDGILAQYGPGAQSTREHLRSTVAENVDRIWPKNGQPAGHLTGDTHGAEAIFSMLHDLTPTTDDQKSLKSQALSLGMNLGQTRWLLYAQQEASVSKPLVVIVVFWLTINFISFGLFA